MYTQPQAHSQQPQANHSAIYVEQVFDLSLFSPFLVLKWGRWIFERIETEVETQGRE